MTRSSLKNIYLKTKAQEVKAVIMNKGRLSDF